MDYSSSEAGGQQQQQQQGEEGGDRDLSVVQCGVPFYLEIEALDSFNNR